MTETASSAALVPAAGEVFLDHVGLFMPEAQASPEAFIRLGFTLTPFARHGDAAGPGGARGPSGTGNRCAMFRQGYLELLAPTGEDTPLARQLHQSLARHPGLHLIAFAVADAEARHRQLPARGLAPLPLVRLKRPVPTAVGEGIAGFDVVRLPPGIMAEGRVQMLTHATPDLVWQRRHLDHDNGARALTGALVCVADAAEAANRFARFVDRPIAGRGGAFEVALHRGRVTLVEAEALARVLPGVTPPALPWIAAFGVAVADPAVTERLLAAHNVTSRRLEPGRLHVAGAQALGAHLIFHAAEGGPWP